MCLHLGQDIMLQTNELIALLDLQMMDCQTIRSSDHIVWVDTSGQTLKSIIVTDDGWYLSSIRLATLYKRVQEAIGDAACQ
ncbi:MAG: extracellular matrix/biofilm biosynthesis regulator RemA family protein [Sporolactobacillus sp.]